MVGGGFLKLPSGLINSLEGLTELTKSFYIHGYGLLQGKGTDYNLPKEEMPGQSWGRFQL